MYVAANFTDSQLVRLLNLLPQIKSLPATKIKRGGWGGGCSVVKSATCIDLPKNLTSHHIRATRLRQRVEAAAGAHRPTNNIPGGLVISQVITQPCASFYVAFLAEVPRSAISERANFSKHVALQVQAIWPWKARFSH